jgi:hypothetical protein
VPEHSRKIFIELTPIQFRNGSADRLADFAEMFKCWHQTFNQDGHDGLFYGIALRAVNSSELLVAQFLDGVAQLGGLLELELLGGLAHLGSSLAM